jgi:two-component system, NtrC family, sensor kinase
MNGRVIMPALISDIAALFRFRGRLRPKFVLVFTTVVCVALISTATFEVLFSFQDRKAALIRIQHEQAEAAASEIAEFMRNIEEQLAWTTHEPWTTTMPDQQSLDLWRMMLRQVPAITDLSLLDGSGRERLRVSRLSLDEIDSQLDFSKDPKFLEAQAGRPYRSPVYFRGGSEPYLTISLRARNASVSVAEVNLKFIWDVVSQIKVGEHGQAYVVDGEGRLIAHPDISMVLRNTDLSNLAQVRAARSETAGPTESTQLAKDTYGRKVLTASAAIAPLDWTMLVELPVGEAYAPLYSLILRVSILLLVGLLLAFIADLFLVRWIVHPLEQLEKVVSTVRRTKDYTLRVDRKSDDEIGRLAVAFNEMLSELSAARERESSEQFELARVSRLTTMGAMTASIAHEINQPLAAIAANANAGLRWLSRPTPDIDEVHAALKRINNDAHRASEVIQSVRSIFKKAPQQGALVDVNGVIQEVLSLVHAEIISSHVSIRSDLLQDLPRVRADRIQLQQVILNLITNAIEAMGSVEGRQRLLIVTSQRQEPNSVLVTVQDNGPGIDPDARDRIFDAFFSTKSSGMGMGLFICRSTIEAHGGHLRATPAEPGGTIFHLVLPIGEPAEDAEAGAGAGVGEGGAARRDAVISGGTL